MPDMRPGSGIVFTMSWSEHVPKNGALIHRAKWVMADPSALLTDGYVRVDRGIITAVGQGGGGDGHCRVLHHEPGVLMPALVNAHIHLDLCGLNGKTRLDAGFIPWVLSVIAAKEAMPLESLESAARQGAVDMMLGGCLAAGDIASTGFGARMFADLPFSGVCFQEYLGAGPTDVGDCRKLGRARALSLAGHGPHTTAPELLSRLKSRTLRRGLPFTLHLAESHAEDLFLRTGRGEWADFLSIRGINTSGWGLRGDSPVRHAFRLGLLDAHTLAVHLVFASPDDLDLLAGTGAYACLCPRSNRRLHHRLPDLPAMLRAGLRLCLGTDSLASVPSLSMLDELAYFINSFPGVSPRDALAMATINGAAALGLDAWLGTLEPGKRADMMLVPVSGADAGQVLENLVHADFTGNPTLYHGGAPLSRN